jgi:hypothetical protein
MLGLEIVDYFRQQPLLKKHFLGVFAADSLPNLIPRLREKKFAVINTDIAAGDGKHWYALFKVNKNLECFDSLGLRDGETILDRLEPVKKVIFNKSPVQPLHSDKCGWYAIYFATARMLNCDLPFQEILNDYFEKDLEVNDQIVEKFRQNKELPELENDRFSGR